MLTASKLTALGRLMEIEAYPANRAIFEEGEAADKMYVVVSGRVGIFKRRPGEPANPGSETWASQNMLLAEFSPDAKSPWFGETALFNQAPRQATAFTVESTQLLSCHRSQAQKMKQLIPEFFQMNATYSKAYKVTNQLNGSDDSAPSHLSAKMAAPVGLKTADGRYALARRASSELMAPAAAPGDAPAAPPAAPPPKPTLPGRKARSEEDKAKTEAKKSIVGLFTG